MTNDNVQIDSRYATVGDLFAHAQWLKDRGRHREAKRMHAAAEVALARAGGDRAKRLVDVSDQKFRLN